jgi:hypothetical protein
MSWKSVRDIRLLARNVNSFRYELARRRLAVQDVDAGRHRE